MQSRVAGGTTVLEQLPTTDSGAIRKSIAMEWFANRSRPFNRELLEVITPKSKGHTGGMFATDISNVRVTGDAAYIETIAGPLQPFLQVENTSTRLESNLQ